MDRGIESRYRFEDTRGVAEQSSGVYSPGAAPSHAYLRNSKRRQARLRVHRHTVRSHLRDLHTVQAKIRWTLARFWHRSLTSLLTELRPPPIRSKIYRIIRVVVTFFPSRFVQSRRILSIFFFSFSNLRDL